MIREGHIGLLKMELPEGDVLLATEGFQVWGAETYLSSHPVFGRIASVSAMSEGVGDQVPAHEITFQPAPGAALGDLTRPGDQGARVRFWLAKFNVETHAIVGTPDLEFDGQVDQTVLTVGSVRELTITVVSGAERAFAGNTGNALTPAWHKSIWPGETGHDNATGLVVQDAWGTERPGGLSQPFSPGGSSPGGYDWYNEMWYNGMWGPG